MYAVKWTDKSQNTIRSGLMENAFSLNNTPEIVTYDTYEQAEADIVYLKNAAKEVAPTMSFEVVNYEY